MFEVPGHFLQLASPTILVVLGVVAVAAAVPTASNQDPPTSALTSPSARNESSKPPGKS